MKVLRIRTECIYRTCRATDTTSESQAAGPCRLRSLAVWGIGNLLPLVGSRMKKSLARSHLRRVWVCGGLLATRLSYHLGSCWTALCIKYGRNRLHFPLLLVHISNITLKTMADMTSGNGFVLCRRCIFEVECAWVQRVESSDATADGRPGRCNQTKMRAGSLTCGSSGFMFGHDEKVLWRSEEV